MIITSIIYSNAHYPVSDILPALNALCSSVLYVKCNILQFNVAFSSQKAYFQEDDYHRGNSTPVTRRLDICWQLTVSVYRRYQLPLISSVPLCQRWVYRHIQHILLVSSYRSREIFFFYQYCCASYYMCKLLGALWSKGHIRLFAHYARYPQYTDLSESVGHVKCLLGKFRQVCV